MKILAQNHYQRGENPYNVVDAEFLLDGDELALDADVVVAFLDAQEKLDLHGQYTSYHGPEEWADGEPFFSASHAYYWASGLWLVCELKGDLEEVTDMILEEILEHVPGKNRDDWEITGYHNSGVEVKVLGESYRLDFHREDSPFFKEDKADICSLNTLLEVLYGTKLNAVAC